MKRAASNSVKLSVGFEPTRVFLPTVLQTVLFGQALGMSAYK